MTDEKPIVKFDFDYFVELSPDLICVASYDGYFKHVNAAVLETLGYSMEELLANPINFFLHPDDRELTARKSVELLEGGAVLQFLNRYVTKQGEVIRLFWTSVRIERDQLIFAIAKNVTQINIEHVDHVDRMLSTLDTDQMRRFNADVELIEPSMTNDRSNLKWMGITSELDNRDQLWLNRFEGVIRANVGMINISLAMISSEMATSERQLFRQVRRIMQMTPSQLVRIIRFHMAWEAIASKKKLGLDQIAAIAGYASKKHFRKTFAKTFGIDVLELL